MNPFRTSARQASRLKDRRDSRRRRAFERLEDRAVPATFAVINTLDSGAGSLRQAILNANAAPGADTITFNTVALTGPGLQTITLASALPQITSPLTIDGTTQPDYAGTPLININGNGLGSNILDVANVAATFKALKVSGYTATAVNLNNADNSVLQGLDLSDPAGNYNQTGVNVTNGSDGVTIQNVNASGTNLGIQVTSSASPVIKNNILKNSGSGANNPALYLNNVTGLAVGAISGNAFDGSTAGLRIDNGQTGLIIGDASVAGAQICIEDNTSGMNTVSSRAIYLNNVDNATIDNVDLGYTLISRSGEGIRADTGCDFLTIKNTTIANRATGIEANGGKDLTLTNNTLTNDAQAIDLSNLAKQTANAALIASGNVFTNSGGAFRLNTLTGANAGLTFGTSGTNVVINNATDGLNTVTGTVIQLSNADNVTITGLNLAYNGSGRSGTGINADTGTDNLVIQNVTSTNHGSGIQVSGGTDPTFTNNTLTNNNIGLYVDSATDGADAGTTPITASGNVVGNSSEGMRLWNMSGVTVGTTGTEAVVVNNATDGFNTANTGLYFRNTTGVTVNGLDLSWTGSASRTGSGILADGNQGSNVTIQNVTATNRGNGISMIVGGNNAMITNNMLSNNNTALQLTGGGQDLTVTNNTLTNSGTGLYLDGFSDGADSNSVPVVASGNVVTNDSTGFQLFNMTSQFIGASGTGIIIASSDGLNTTSTGLWVRSLPSGTVDGLDVSWIGTGSRNGTGVLSDSNLGANFTVRNVTATNRSTGIDLHGGGQDLTLTNNNLGNDTQSLYLDSFTDGADADTVPVVGSGNVVTNSAAGFRIYSLTGQYIGTSGTGLIVDNTSDGFKTVTGNALQLRNMPSGTVDGLDLSWTGSNARSGAGILSDSSLGANFKVQNVIATNRTFGLQLQAGGQDLTLLNNTLTNNNTSLYLDGFSDGGDADSVPVVGSGNVVTNSAAGFQLFNMTALYVGTSGTGLIVNNASDGLNTVSGNALYVRNLPSSTIDGLDLTYASGYRTGNGIYSDSGMGAGFTIQNVTAMNRAGGIMLTGGGQDLTLNNNNLANDSQAIDLISFTDGGDSNTVPVIASGNNVSNSSEAYRLWNMTGQFIGTSGTGIIINNATDGLQTSLGGGTFNTAAIYLRNFDNSTISGLDVSWTGSSSRTGRGIYSDTQTDTITVTGIAVGNRNEGIRFDSGSSVNINNSTASNNNTGINANSASNATLVNNNRIEGNTTGLTAQAGGVQVNATSNYWGSASGPGAGGNNGSSGNASTTSFLTSAPAGAPAPPTIPGNAITSAAPSVFAVTTNADIADGTTTSISALLANPGADNAISLREAILAANATAGTDTITFNIGTGAQTIRLASALPQITGSVTIDGTSQPAYAGTPLITIDGFGLGGQILDVLNSTATISALKITGFSGIAVRLSNADNSSLSNLDITNPKPIYTSETGVSVESGSDNVVLQNINVATYASSNGIYVGSSANPTIRNNTLAGGTQTNAAALNLDTVTGLAAGAVSGNNFAGSSIAVRLWNMSGITIGDTAGANIVLADGASGLGSAGTALYLRNIDNSTVDGLDLSWTGVGARQGTGILSDASSDALTISNVTATNRGDGINISGGTDLALTNNTLSNDNRSLSVDSVTDGSDAGSAPMAASGNIVTGSATGMQLWNMTGLTIGTSATDIVINNAADGLNSNSSNALYIRNLDNSTISNLDLSWTGVVRSGNGLFSDGGTDSLTVQNVSATNRSYGFLLNGGGKDLTLIGNNLANNTQALYVDSFTDGTDSDSAPMTATGTVVTGSQAGMQLWNMTGLTIGTSGANIVVNNSSDGFKTVPGTTFYFRNVDNSTISNLDLSWAGTTRSGTGISSDSSMDNFTIQGVVATNRGNGVQLTGGQDLTINTLDVSNDNYGLYLDGFTDGADVGTAPIMVSGITFTNSSTVADGNSAGLTLFNMSNLTVGPALSNNVIIANTNGLKTNPQNALWIRNLANAVIDGLDLSYTGTNPRSGRGIYSDSNLGANVTIQNVSASNRSDGINLGGGGSDLTLSGINVSNSNQALTLISFTDGADANTVPVVAADLNVTGSTNGLFLNNMSGQFVGTSGTGILINNTASGLQSTSRPLWVRALANSTIDGLDLAYSGAARTGEGIYSDNNIGINFKIQNVTSTNRVTGIQLSSGGQDLTLINNNLSNDNTSLYLDSFSDGADANTVAVVGSGNVVTNSLYGFWLFNDSSMFVGTSGTGLIVNNATDGFPSVLSRPIWIRNTPNLTIDGLDVSWSGSTLSGEGIYSDSGLGASVTIKNVTATNRSTGIFLNNGGQDLVLLNNNLSNNATALSLRSFTDGSDSDSAPFSGSGNLFTNSAVGISLASMTPTSLVIGDTNVANANFIVRDTDGLRTTTANAITASDVDNVTIDGLDLSYYGTTRSGTGLKARSGSDNWTVKNVSIANRQVGLEFNPDTSSSSPTYLVKVSDSNFINNDTGLSIVQYNAGGFVNGSRIEGNGVGLAYSTWGGPSPAPVVLNAKTNYWGPGGGAGTGGNNGYTGGTSVDASAFVTSVPSALLRDYGDAPASFGFGSTLRGFGARHIATGPQFGASRDAEGDTSPSTLANTDDITATDDEDGIAVGILNPGSTSTATIVVSGGSGLVDAWIDFNRDGDWNDPGEQIANGFAVSTGTNTLSFAVPSDAAIGLNYARFRISTLGGLDTYGEAVDGEVEDLVAGPIWADDAWAGMPNGTYIVDADPVMAGEQHAVVGANAFGTVGGAIAAAPFVNGLVIVNSGDYSAEAVIINKSALTVRFQEGANSLGSLDDTVSDATVKLAGVVLTVGANGNGTRLDSTITGSGSLVKVGSGTMILANNEAYTGSTTVSGGTLSLQYGSNNNLATSPTISLGQGASLDVSGLSFTRLDLAAGQTLQGSGTITGGSLNALSGATLAPAGASGIRTAILNTGAVSLVSGSVLNIELDGTTAGTQYDQIKVTGNVSLANPTLAVSLGATPAIGDQFAIIDNNGGGAVSGTFLGLSEGATFRLGVVTLQITYLGGADSNDVVLTVTDVTYIWDGGSLVDGNWSTAANWTGDVAPTTGSNLEFPTGAARLTNNNDLNDFDFYRITIAAAGYDLGGNAIGLIRGISTTFGAGSSSIGLDIDLQASPTVDVAAGGALSLYGSISGTGFGLTKTNGGRLSLSGDSDYTGATSITAGTLVAGSGDALGTGPVAVSSDAALDLTNSVTLANAITLAGTGIAGSGALVNLSGDNALTGPVSLTHDASVGGDIGTLTLSNEIADGGDGFGLTKVGGASLILSGASRYTGSTAVMAGLLQVDGSIGASAGLTVGDGATLRGTGSTPALTVTGSGIVAPGDSLGILNAAAVSLSSDSKLSVELNGRTVGEQYDQLAVTGTVDLGGATLFVSLGFTASGGDRFTIIDNKGPNPIVGTFAGLAEGATFTTGSNTFRISYAGGTNHEDVVLTAVGTPTAVAASSSSPAAFGQAVTFSVTVTGIDVTPTGNVTLLVDGGAVETVALVDGAASFTAINNLSVGTHVVEVDYAGDANNFATTDVLDGGQHVDKAGTTTVVTSSANPSAFGQSVTFTASVTADAPGAGTPDGTVDFVIDGEVVGDDVPLDGSGQATFRTSSLVSGSHSVAISYSGRTSYSASGGSLAGGQEVVAASTTTAVASSVNSSVFGQSVTFTAAVAVVAPGAGTPPGTVDFVIDGVTVGDDVPLDALGVATLSTSSLGAGSHVVTVNYAGVSNYVASDGTLAGGQVVVSASTTTTVASSVSPSVFGQEVTFTATVAAVAPGAGTPTGIVTFHIDGDSALVGTVVGGVASVSTTALAVGNHSITADFAPDTANFDVSGGSLEGGQSVDAASTTTALSSSVNPSVFGQSVTFTAAVAAVEPGSGVPSGSIQFIVDGSTFGSPVALDAAGQATLSTASLSVGGHSIGAAYLGSASFLASSGSLAGGQAVDAASTTTGVASSLDPSVFGQSVTFTATVEAVAPGAGVPSGSIQFIVDGANFGAPVALNGSGQAALSTASLGPGSHSILASYLGSSSFLVSSGSLGGGQVVNQASTSTSVFSSVNPSLFGQSVTFSATVSPQFSGTPTGTATLVIDLVAVQTVALAGGQATFGAVGGLTLGTHAVTVNYSGDSGFSNSSGSLADGQTVIRIATTTAVASDDASSVYGDAVTFSALVHPNVSGPALTGSVRFYDGATLLGTRAVNTIGVAVFTTSAMPASGSPHSITAVYEGDTFYDVSASSPFAQDVDRAVLTVTADDLRRAYGDANPSLTARFSGFKNGETLATSGVTGSPTLFTAAAPASPVGGGPYAITSSAGSLSAANYAFTFVAGQLSLTQATLTVTANDLSRVYGDANPTLSALVSGFKNGESLATSDVTGTPALSTGASPTSPVAGGPYAIASALGSLASGNYAFRFVDGSLAISPAALLVTADDLSRVYGDANPTLSATFSGFRNDETLATSDITGSPGLSTLAVPTSPVSGGPYAIAASVGTLASGNYTFLFLDGDLAVTRAMLTVTADDLSRIYGDANPTLTSTFSGFKNGETLATSDITGALGLSTAATPTSPVLGGPYAISASVGSLSSGNYAFQLVDGHLDVTPATLTVTASDLSRVYGDANPALAATFGGFRNGESLGTSDVTGSPALATLATLTSPVGASPYAISSTLGTLTSGNYTFQFVAGHLAVTPATLTVTADDVSRTYGDANPTLTAHVSGFKNGEDLATGDVSGFASLATPADAASAVTGSPYAITSSQGTLASGNYTFQFVNGLLTITPATLMVTANDLSRIYGDANPTLSATFTGFKNGETLSTSDVTGAPGLATAATPSSPVIGAPYTITTALGTLLSGNYTFQLVDGNLDVAPATLVVTASDQSRIYGDANLALTATIRGFKNGETLATSGVTGTPGLATLAASTCAVSASPYAIAASVGTLASGNYVFSFVDGQLSVTQATLVVTVDDLSRIYGDANPTLTSTFSGFKNGETVATSDVTGVPGLSTAATPASPVLGGPYAISASVGSLSSGNYAFQFVDGHLAITPAALVVVADDLSRVYGDANPTLTAAISGFKNGENLATSDVTGAPALCTPAGPASPVAGSPYAIADARGTLASGNYAFEFVAGHLYVTPATLTVTAEDLSRIYGDANPTLTATFGGFKNGESLATSDVTGLPALSTAAVPTSPVAGGPYAISASLGTLSSGNYVFTFAGGQLAVTPAVLTVTADDLSRIYGDANPTLTSSFSGFKNGEDLASSDVTGAPDLATPATAASAVIGSPYAIVASAGTLSSGNYAFIFVPGGLTVTPAVLTVTADDLSRIYGDANPTLTASFAGFKNGETLATSDVVGSPSLGTTATPVSPVGDGPYAISAAPGALSSGNYTFRFLDGGLDITRATLTVTADDQSRTYGDSNPASTAHFSGFKNGETLGTSDVTGVPQLYSNAGPASPVADGPYTIFASAGSLASGNYDFQFIDGKLDITRAALMITADDLSMVFGTAVPALSASYSGFVNGDTPASLDTPVLLTTAATPTSPVAGSPYSIEVSEASSRNYVIHFVDGRLAVSPATPPMSLVATAPIIVFGQSVVFTVTLDGGAGVPTGTVAFFDGSTPLGTMPLDASGSASLNTSGLGVDEHTITAIYSGDGNYLGTTGNLLIQDVNKADVSVIVSASSPTTFGEPVTLTATLAAVAPGAGTPTGLVRFFSGSTILGTASLDASAMATFTTTALGAGQNLIWAAYVGDGEFNPNASASTVQTVAPGSTAVALATLVDHENLGVAVTFTATVSAISPAAGEPTGMLTFFDGANPIASVPLDASGVAALTLDTLSVGSHPITVVYTGDANFRSGESPTVTQTVERASSSTTLTASSASAVFGQSITFTASVAAVSGTATPTSLVSFFDGATPLGTVALANGSASLTTAVLGAGTHTITAVYSGDSNFLDSTSLVLTQVVNPAATTVALTSSADIAVFGQPVLFTATVAPVAPGAGNIDGEMSLYDGSTRIGSAPLNGGTATFEISSLSVGTHTLAVAYDGDAQFLASSSTLLIQRVAADASIVLVDTPSRPSVLGEPITLSVTVIAAAPGSGTSSGVVTLLDGDTILGAATLGADGRATLSTASLTAGSHSLTVRYSGDANFGASSSATSPWTVRSADTSTLATVSSTSTGYGQPVTITAQVQVSAPGAGMPAGRVEFFDGTAILGWANVVDGTAKLITTGLTAGPHSLSAIFFGDPGFSDSNSSPQSLTVNTGPSATSINTSGASVFGQPVTITAFVSATIPGALPPTGRVTFRDGVTVLGTSELSGNLAQIVTSALSAGQHEITAAYEGDAILAGSSAGVVQTVGMAPTVTTLASSAASVPYGQGVVLTAVVSAVAPGAGAPGGVVDFYQGSTLLASAPIVNGQAVITLTNLDASQTHQITARYAGDANLRSSTSAPVSIAVSEESGRINVVIPDVVSTNPASRGLARVFATVVSPDGAIPDGKLILRFHGKTIRTKTLVNGLASFVIPRWRTHRGSLDVWYLAAGSRTPSLQAHIPNGKTTITGVARPAARFLGHDHGR